MINNPEKSSFQPEDFKARLDLILSRQLTPDTIDSYATNALDELVELTERASASYDLQPTITGLSQTNAEDKAFNYFNLGELERSLDHVADLAESINSIDEVIKQANVMNGVIVPPNDVETNIAPSDGSFKEKNTHERLKTTLFILQQDFGVDIHDPEALQLTTGGTEGIMRNSSYNLVEALQLERVILVCDEEGNVTYVFDAAKLAQLGTQLTDLMNLTKDELNDLIETNPGTGKRIVYSDHFIKHIKDSISDDISNETNISKPQSSTANYLKPTEKAPDDYLSINGMQTEFGIAKRTIRDAVEFLSDELGEIIKARFGRKTADAFSPVQQEMIRAYLESKGHFTALPPEGHLSLNGMANELGIGRAVTENAIKRLQLELGEIIKARFGSRVADAYSPTQQKVVREYLENTSNVLTEKAPTGYGSVYSMAKEFRVAEATVAKAVNELNEALGEVIFARFNAVSTKAFSPAQQEMVRTHLEAQGVIGNNVPEGYMSVNGLMAKFNVANSSITRVIHLLDGRLGNVISAKSSKLKTVVYSPAQQEMIRACLEELGLFAEDAPEGYRSINGIANNFNVSHMTVDDAIKTLSEQLGESIKARVSARIADVYSPAQQEVIRIYLEEKGLFIKPAPEGYLSMKRIGIEFGAARPTLLTAIEELGSSIGEPVKARIGGRVTDAYSPVQQEMIRTQLRVMSQRKLGSSALR